MAKIKSKLWAKIFNNKSNFARDEYDKTKSKKPYFNNVVPPINNKNTTFKNNSDSTVYDAQNVQVTSSYIIPLQEKRPFASTFSSPQPDSPYYEEEVLDNSLDTMALVSFKNTFKIPKAISKEIKIEKLKNLILLFVSFLVLVVSSTFIALYFTNRTDYIPHPVLTIPLLIIFTTIALINLIDFVNLRKEVDLYIERTLKGSLLPPHFIIRNYRKIHANLIILNWISSSSYVILSIVIGIMFLISGQKLTFIVQTWTVTVPNIIKDAVTLTIILALIFTFHMTNIIIFRFRKRNIISYYGYEIINVQELNEYKKKINRICMWITIGFASLIFFAIVIPIFVVKRRRKKQ